MPLTLLVAKTILTQDGNPKYEERAERWVCATPSWKNKYQPEKIAHLQRNDGGFCSFMRAKIASFFNIKCQRKTISIPIYSKE